MMRRDAERHDLRGDLAALKFYPMPIKVLSPRSGVVDFPPHPFGLDIFFVIRFDHSFRGFYIHLERIRIFAEIMEETNQFNKGRKANFPCECRCKTRNAFKMLKQTLRGTV